MKQTLLPKMKNGTTVDQNLIALIAKIGEKITIGKRKQFQIRPQQTISIYILLLKII